MEGAGDTEIHRIQECGIPEQGRPCGHTPELGGYGLPRCHLVQQEAGKEDRRASEVVGTVFQESIAIAKSRTSGKTKIRCTRYGNVMCSRGSVIPLCLS